MEIDLREVLYRICIHWRVLILLMLVFAFIFGILGYLHGDSAHGDSAKKLNSDIEDVRKEIEKLEGVIEVFEKEPAGSEEAEKALQGELAKKKMELAENRAELESLQRDLADHIRNDAAVSKIQPKWIVIGLAAGLFFGGVWYIASVMFRSVLLNPEDVEDNFSLQLLGTFPKDKKKSRKGVDRLIDRVFAKNTCITDFKENRRLIASRIVLTVKAEKAESVFISDSVMSNVSDEFIGKLVEELRNAGVSAECGKSVLHNSSSVECLYNYKSFVAVYGIDVTPCEEIIKERLLCQRNGLKFIGCIVAE